MKINNKLKKFSTHGMMDNGGNLNLSLYFPNHNLTKEQEEKALALALAGSTNAMLSKGYLPANSRFMSPSDVAEEHGKSRQYWEKLIKQGKIPHQKTAAGMITCDLWVQGYLNNKEKVDEYIRNQDVAVKLIKESGKTHGKIECPDCGEDKFDFNVNTSDINGLCRANCGFQIYIVN